MSNRDKLYRYHVENVRAIDDGLDRVERMMRHAVSVGNANEIKIDVRMYALLLGVWGEARLNKLLHEPAFSNDERVHFQNVEAHIERWKVLVETAFRKRYRISQAELNATTLPHSAHSRYISLISLLDEELRPIITLRNKLAHGQWVYPLATGGESIAQEQFDALRTENALSLQLKRKLILSLLEAVHFLRVSEATFDREFDRIYGRIQQLRQQLRNKPYASYAEMLRFRRARGIARAEGSRANNPVNSSG